MDTEPLILTVMAFGAAISTLWAWRVGTSQTGDEKP